MDTSERPGNRLQEYKRLKTEPEDVKTTRKAVKGLQLRREERHKQFAMKRELGSKSIDSIPLENNEQPISQWQTVQEETTEEDEMQQEPDVHKKEEKNLYTSKEIKEQAKLLYSENEEDLLGPVSYFRKYLVEKCMPSCESGDVVNASSVVDLGILPRIMELLSTAKGHELKFETAWVVTNIAGGANEYTKQIVDGGCVPALMQMLSVENYRLSGQVFWALGNIIGDGAELRDKVLDHGIVPAILKFADHLSLLTVEQLNTLSWVISTLCRFRPYRDVDEILPLLGLLKGILTVKRSESSIIDVCWSLSYFTDEKDPHIQPVVDSDLCPLLMDLFKEVKTSVPALKTLGNIAHGNDVQLQYVLDLGIMAHLEPLLQFQRNSVTFEVMYLLFNIVGGTQEQIQTVVDAGLVEYIVKYLVQGNGRIQCTCRLAVSNLLSKGTPEQIK
jgi:hypothetical protein